MSFDAQIKTAYKTGLQDGLAKAARRLQLMERTHHRLYEELCRLDNYAPYPDGKEVIHIPDYKICTMIKRFRKLKDIHWPKYLEALRREQLGRFCNLPQGVR